MKKAVSAMLALFLLTGCGIRTVPEETFSETISLDVSIPENTSSVTVTEPTPEETDATVPQTASEEHYTSRFDSVTEVKLSDEGIQVNGGEETDSVFTSNDIIYYEDLETYDSGNPYGEGTEEERHTEEEADSHTVVNITKPGAYRISGKLSAGQIRVDLGEDAYEEKDAVVELILDNVDIACTVAPAILFLNTYECDGDWSTETAQPEVDTTTAGANLILEGTNTVSGSHVAKIFKDKDGEKKLWKQDGAIYSYMSLNVFGPGSLELKADNEGLDTELHLTIHGGNISIYSQNDGINTNEDGVSVTTIHGGNLTIFAGLGVEGDGIDSNGYLVINGGSVVSAANPKSDAGLDSDLGSFINGGTVIAMGSTMDWAESDSDQVTMNLQFASRQPAGAKIAITKEDGTEVFSFDSGSEYARSFSGLILSHPALEQGETYHVSIDGQQMGYTGNDMGRGGRGSRRHEGMELPEDFDPEQWQNWENRKPPEDNGSERSVPSEGELPEDFDPDSFFGGRGNDSGKIQTGFYMNDTVNAFSGVMVMADKTD